MRVHLYFQESINSLNFRVWVAAKARGGGKAWERWQHCNWSLRNRKPKREKEQVQGDSVTIQEHLCVRLLIRKRGAGLKACWRSADLCSPLHCCCFVVQISLLIKTHPGRGLLRVSNVTGDVIRFTLSLRISSSVRKPKPISSTAWRITVLS